MKAFAYELASTYPEMEFIDSFGTSVEGLDLFALKIGGTSPGATRAIYLQGGLHAREWVSPSTVMYIANELCVSTSPAVAALKRNVQIIIAPLVNPDGYEFTWTNNRLWRKNRNINAGSACVGVDLNRNWDDHFGGGGSSGNPCSDVYRGEEAFDQPETKAVEQMLISLDKDLIAGIDFHAYGQLILRPFGWQYPFMGRPSNDPEMNALGAAMKEEIRRTSGMDYTSEHSAELYIAAGGADDWFWSVATSEKIGYCIELRDTGRYGFVLPPDQIQPTGEEAFAAFMVLGEHVMNRP